MAKLWPWNSVILFVVFSLIHLEPISTAPLDNDINGKDDPAVSDSDTSLPSDPLAFPREVLNEHNRLRAWHCAPPLELYEDMNKFAQNWAQSMAKARSADFNPENPDFGENLWEGTHLNGTKIAQRWYYESRRYNFSSPESSYFLAPEFTQLVWKSTEKIGVGAAKSDVGVWYVAVYYSPRSGGDDLDAYRQNVFPKSKLTACSS